MPNPIGEAAKKAAGAANLFRMPSPPRPNWQRKAAEFGFKFHTMHGQAYWDESAYYQFTLKQIEQDIEDPTVEIHQMCLDVVDRVVGNEQLLTQFKIPEKFWDMLATSWQTQQPSLYSRLDFCYQGNGPAKLYENNADTPTSLYESGFWQWLWLQDLVDNNQLARNADQFNSLQEKLIHRLAEIANYYGEDTIHFASCKDTDEDRGTVQYLQDCAAEAGLTNPFVFIEDIGIANEGCFTDLQDKPITTLFKLYPWEFMQREEFGDYIESSEANWIEPIWKSVLSNKALMPMLWKLHKGHPNLLPSYFEHELNLASESKLVKKPIYSREGANISVIENGNTLLEADGPYGEEGYIYQAYCALPQFDDNFTLIGSWLVNDQSAGISVREDTNLITQDLSRYLPHVILG